MVARQSVAFRPQNGIMCISVNDTAIQEGGQGTMAKIERSLQGDFHQILNHIENGILGGSVSASLEEASDFESGGARCSVRVFERYSYMGGNRLSLSVTLFQNEDSPVYLSAVAAGGSQAMFFKINTWGEEAFLQKLEELL